MALVWSVATFKLPYITPDEVPYENACRALLIPASPDWLAIVSGALTELTKGYNWEQGGSVTVAEAVAVMQDMVNGYYAGGCDSCALPGGDPVFQLGEDGQVRQLINGTWNVPNGEYEIPPTPARTDPTPDERMCLAAANASAVLKLLYEDLTDSIAEHLSAYDAAVKLGVAVTGGIGLVFGLITPALIGILGSIWAVGYDLVQFVTMDLWDEAFDEVLLCALQNCASDDDGVVHFDYDCVIQNLAGATELEVTLSQLRLFAQMQWLINSMGIEALDAAGAKTDVEEADCSDCSVCETYDEDMSEGVPDKTNIVQVDPTNITYYIFPTSDPDGEWVPDTLDGRAGYIKGTATYPDASKVASIVIDLGRECFVESWSYDWIGSGAYVCDQYVQFVAFDGSGEYITSGGGCRGNGVSEWATEYYLNFDTVVRYLYFVVFSYTGGGGLNGIRDVHIEIS